MKSIQIPDYIKTNRVENYLIIQNKQLLPFIHTLYTLGGFMTFQQHIEYLKLINPSIGVEYARKKSKELIKTLQANYVIDTGNINTTKYIYLRDFGITLATKKDNRWERNSQKQNLKDHIIRTKLIKVENYLTTKEIICKENMHKHLIYITKQIYDAAIKDRLININRNLLKQIIQTNANNNILKSIDFEKENKLIKIIWHDIYNIYKSLNLQGQTISLKPIYYKLFKSNSELTIHYVPEIILFDVHKKDYYSQKIDILFHQFYNITDNETEFTQKYYREKGTLGHEGYNKIAYTLKIIGSDLNSLTHVKNYLDSFIKNNPNAILLTNTKIKHVDVNKYFNHSSSYKKQKDNIDNQITNLILKEMELK